MFIKRDTRKISEILVDPLDSRESLRLARRAPEFNGGSTQGLLHKDHSQSFTDTRFLSLYNNKLTTLSGVSTLVSAGAPLEDLVLGNNQLASLPASLAGLSGSLRRLWVEDNALKGAVPPSVFKLTNLRLLRLSGNHFDTLPDAIGSLVELEELALDGNAFTHLPEALGSLRNLRTLNVRGNALTALPSTLGGCTSLTTLSASTNALTHLPPSIGACAALTTLSLNGNPHLTTLPPSLAACKKLKRAVLAHCAISWLPLPLVCAWATSLPPALVASAHILLSDWAEKAAHSTKGSGSGSGSSSSSSSSSSSVFVGEVEVEGMVIDMEGRGGSGSGSGSGGAHQDGASLELWDECLRETREGSGGGGGGGGSQGGEEEGGGGRGRGRGMAWERRSAVQLPSRAPTPVPWPCTLCPFNPPPQPLAPWRACTATWMGTPSLTSVLGQRRTWWVHPRSCCGWGAVGGGCWPTGRAKWRCPCCRRSLPLRWG